MQHSTILARRAPPEAPHRPYRLVSDTRGAILVLGLLLGVLLSGSLWSLLRLGQAVSDRESARAAVDASALENAIWHARGMNMIAALNVTMALVIGVLVIWRLALAATTLASLAAVAASALNAGIPAGAGSLPPELPGTLLGADTEIAARVLSIVSGLGAAQAAVAAYTPLLASQAETSYSVAGRSVRPDSFSGSGAQSRGEPGTDLDCSGESTLAESESAAPLLGSPVSLPVQRDHQSLLCERPQDWAPRAELAFGQMTQAAPSALLDPSAPAAGRALRALGFAPGQGFVELVANAAGLEAGLAPAVFCAPWSAPLDELASVLRAAPKAVLPSEANAEARRLRRALIRSDGELRCGRPAKLWPKALNGSPYLRSAAVLPEPAGSDAAALAHAEMYFDCSDEPRRCAADAAWQLRWTARLRRVRSPSVLLERARTPTASAAEPATVDPGPRAPRQEYLQ
jgi:hypothetical protein